MLCLIPPLFLQTIYGTERPVLIELVFGRLNYLVFDDMCRIESCRFGDYNKMFDMTHDCFPS